MEERFKSASLNNKSIIAGGILSCVHTFDLIRQGKDFVQATNADESLNSNSEYVSLKADIILDYERDIDRAISELTRGMELEDGKSLIPKLVRFLIYKRDLDSVTELLEHHHVSALRERTVLLLRSELEVARGDYDSGLAYLAQLRSFEYQDDEFFVQRMFAKLKQKNYREVLEESDEYLKERDFDTKFSVQIVNYELARKLLGKNPSKQRLEKTLAESHNEAMVRAACEVLLGKESEAISTLVNGIDKKYSVYFDIQGFPVFESIVEKVKIRLGELKSVA